MSRVARKDLDSSYFHVIVQGFEKQYIFEDENLLREYLELLISHKDKFDITLLGYCIMSNHAHILLFCKDIYEMSMYMKNVNSKFANIYNNRLKRVGYVFRDRFLSEPIQNKDYLYNCLSYIHYNPINAGMVNELGEYKYSSYNDFINKTGIVNDSMLRILFGSSKQYLEVFNFVHTNANKCMEYKNDTPKITDDEAKHIIKRKLSQCNLNESELNEDKILKYFFNSFLNSKLSLRQIEKFLNINRKKIKQIIG